MSIISKALEKEIKEQNHARKIAGVQELPGSEAPPTAAAVIQHRTEKPRPSAPIRRAVARPSGAAPSLVPTNFGRQFFAMGGLLALVAVGVGFFMADSLTSPPADNPNPSVAKVAVPAAEVAAPVQTPMVVRVEVSVKSDGSASEPQMMPVDRNTLFESRPEPIEEPDYSIEEEMEVPEPPPPPPPPPKRAKPTLEEIRQRFKVDGIFYGDGDPMTIINNEIVREGVEGDGFTVVKIKPDSVILRVDGVEYELR